MEMTNERQGVMIHDALSLSLPPSFARMSLEELGQLFRDDDSNRWGAWDKVCHTMFIVSWKKYGALLFHLADLKGIAKRNESLNQKGYGGHGYKLLGFFSMNAGQIPLEGYRFSYRLGDITQVAPTVLLKHKNTVYSITCLGREENSKVDENLFTEVVTGLQVY